MTTAADTGTAPPIGQVTTGAITHTIALDQYAAAMSAFQGEAEGAAKGRENPHFRSRYARLEDAWRSARIPLAANGLAVQQFPHVEENGRVSVTTLVMHKSGQWTMSTLSLRAVKDDAQACGSAITYACRYAFMAALGLPPEDDDDGNSASASRNGNGGVPPVRGASPPPTDDDALTREVSWVRGAISKATSRQTITELEGRIGKLPAADKDVVVELARARWKELA